MAPAEALAWWTDFQEGRADHAFVPGTSRRIVARGPSFASMEETTRWLGIRVFRERVTAHLGGPGQAFVRFTGTNDYADFDGAYTFEPCSFETAARGEGTRIALDATIRLKPALRWTDVAAKPLVVAILKADLRGHAKEMQRDLKGR